MSKKLREKKRELQLRFEKTLVEAASNLKLNPSELSRDNYIRGTVDFDIKDRLNKEELNTIGGFKEAKGDLLKNAKIKPKILLLDIETTYCIARVWRPGKQYVSYKQLFKETSVLSWSAKWLGDSSDKIMYADTNGQRDVRDDRKILKKMHKLLEEADYVVGQNSDGFDIKILSGRMAIHKMPPPTAFKRFDTYKISKQHFNFPSHSLDYLTDHFCTKYKKKSHSKYPGDSLWVECIEKNNQDAWEHMQVYNEYDVLSLEELFLKLLPWESATIFQAHSDSEIPICSCGSIDFKPTKKYHTTQSSKRRIIKCVSCGAQSTDKENLLSKSKRQSMKSNTPR